MLPEGWKIEKCTAQGMTVVNMDNKAKGLQHRAAIRRDRGKTDADLIAALSSFLEGWG